ncbi:SRPBCC domain-containing protein [Aldersonia sp. NBC_00410]|uniref:SRPBCC family protein n=1 Tax=Aldersonia sp. NBC_00410 TaxID=2975954 RepID=UPI00224DEE90|nr:SRPBCC domain-containing protein [Aldersonia sp. NBC_00410]MCX5045636.1 SRPBCC domain-containing protein [Aldersonia sp. NBC_00410]
MSDREFTIVREFDAPRELVFRAWTDPEQMAKWAGPRGFTTPVSSIVLGTEPGDPQRMTMINDADGTEYVSAGHFVEMVEPERLVFTWGDPTLDSDEDHESLITVTFVELDGKTTMTFHLLAPGPLSFEDGAREGWSQSLDRLVSILTTSPR